MATLVRKYISGSVDGCTVSGRSNDMALNTVTLNVIIKAPRVNATLTK